jgi:prepilin peptidase CpaA
MLSTPALWVAFAAMVPLMLYTAWFDLKYLRIPNWIPLSVLAIYIVTGLWGLSLESFLWGLGLGFGTLAAFFGLYVLLDTLGLAAIGGGDMKLFAALIPFVARADAFEALVIYTLVVLVFIMVFLLVWARTRRSTGMASLDQKRKMLKLASPFGVAMAVTAIVYLGMHVQDSLA